MITAHGTPSTLIIETTMAHLRSKRLITVSLVVDKSPETRLTISNETTIPSSACKEIQFRQHGAGSKIPTSLGRMSTCKVSQNMIAVARTWRGLEHLGVYGMTKYANSY